MLRLCYQCFPSIASIPIRRVHRTSLLTSSTYIPIPCNRSFGRLLSRGISQERTLPKPSTPHCCLRTSECHIRNSYKWRKKSSKVFRSGEASERFKQAVMESERKAAEKQVAKAAFEEKLTTRVNTERFEFRFKQFNSENVGPKGRSRGAVGWRYGTPHDDRSKGHELKIPTSVP